MNPSGLDIRIYPLLSEYLNALPQGLDSYPQATTKSFFSIALHESLLKGVGAGRIPHQLSSRLDAKVGPDAWIPAALYGAYAALTRDVLWRDKSAFQNGMFEIATRMYQAPIYRLFIFLMSPSLVTMGAAQRWGKFHQGTQLYVQNQSKTSVEARVAYPVNLFSEPAIRSIAASLASALTASGAKNVSQVIQDIGPKETKISFAWEF